MRNPVPGPFLPGTLLLPSATKTLGLNVTLPSVLFM